MGQEVLDLDTKLSQFAFAMFYDTFVTFLLLYFLHLVNVSAGAVYTSVMSYILYILLFPVKCVVQSDVFSEQ